jgi:azurin
MTRTAISCAVLATVICVAAPIEAAQAKPAAKSAGAARTITLEGTDAMKFVPAAIAAKPGETIRIVLKAVGKMPKIAMAHNFVLLTPAADVTAYVNDAAKARATNFLPAARKADVLAATGLVGNGETTEVTFTAPKKPGVYTFVCTFPGHFAGGMKGTLTVK